MGRRRRERGGRANQPHGVDLAPTHRLISCEASHCVNRRTEAGARSKRRRTSLSCRAPVHSNGCEETLFTACRVEDLPSARGREVWGGVGWGGVEGLEGGGRGGESCAGAGHPPGDRVSWRWRCVRGECGSGGVGGGGWRCVASVAVAVCAARVAVAVRAWRVWRRRRKLTSSIARTGSVPGETLSSSASLGCRCGSVLYLSPRQMVAQSDASPPSPPTSVAARTSTREPGLKDWYTVTEEGSTAVRKSSRTHSRSSPSRGTGDHARTLEPALGYTAGRPSSCRAELSLLENSELTPTTPVGYCSIGREAEAAGAREGAAAGGAEALLEAAALLEAEPSATLASCLAAASGVVRAFGLAPSGRLKEGLGSADGDGGEGVLICVYIWGRVM